MERWWNYMGRKNQSIRKETSNSVTLINIYPTITGMRWNPLICGEMRAINRLRHDMTQKLSESCPRPRHERILASGDGHRLTRNPGTR